ncbi:MAG: carboxylating nicotinate-nucleotide diphosphorylase [Nitrosopumilus sp. D6]|nr:MAG: carboxylating nicotinate-nucleotide diphosphorylase [Nitrosopumilus sp. D6]
MTLFDFKKELARFVAEDIGRKDITSELLPKKNIKARIITREGCVVAGASHAATIFKMRRCKAMILKKDGSSARKNGTIMEISGRAARILECERTALNLLARMSGIATMTDMMARRIPGTVGLYSTRKTVPGLRYFDKEAVVIGGGKRHRLKLDESVMIKDNHIAADSIEGMMYRAKKRHKKFEIEVEDAENAVLAASGGASVIMLDNFTPHQIRRTVTLLEERGLRRRVRLEASGGITMENIAAYGRTGVDMISAGCITSSVRGIDYSLEVSS